MAGLQRERKTGKQKNRGTEKVECGAGYRAQGSGIDRQFHIKHRVAHIVVFMEGVS